MLQFFHLFQKYRFLLWTLRYYAKIQFNSEKSEFKKFSIFLVRFKECLARFNYYASSDNLKIFQIKSPY